MSGVFSGPMFAKAEDVFWKSIFEQEGMHYNIYSGKRAKKDDHCTMDGLRNLFPEGEANELNFCLFSTSGVHGSYCTIEEVEKTLKNIPNEDDDYFPEMITFLVVHPRVVCMRYGNVKPETQDDIDFLKKLRQSSWDAIKKIGQ